MNIKFGDKSMSGWKCNDNWHLVRQKTVPTMKQFFFILFTCVSPISFVFWPSCTKVYLHPQNSNYSLKSQITTKYWFNIKIKYRSAFNLINIRYNDTNWIIYHIFLREKIPPPQIKTNQKTNKTKKKTYKITSIKHKLIHSCFDWKACHLGRISFISVSWKL